MRWIKAVGAALLLGGLIAAPPWLLLRYIGNPLPAEGFSWAAPLTDGAIIGLLAIVCWLLWVQLMACIAAEVIAAVTSQRIRPRTPLTLGIQQDIARALVGAIAIAITAAVAASGTATAAELPAQTSPSASTVASPQSHVSDEREAPTTGEQARTVTVMRLDTLWSIAEQALGSGERWNEIAALNAGTKMNDGTPFQADEPLRPGWELRIPEHGPEQRVVRKGDTLWGIADEELGDGTRYREIFRASKVLDQPGGERLTTPDHIEPGWTVMMPGAHAQEPPRPTPRRAEPLAPAPDEKPTPSAANKTTPAEPDGRRYTEPSTPEAASMPTAAPEAEPTAHERLSTADDQDTDEKGITGLGALLATAVCLSVGALAVIAANRRRQFRRRRIGRSVASTPQELAALEQVVVEHGTDAQEEVTFLDRALRHVSACCQVVGNPLPQLGAAVLGAEDLTLLFSQPAVGEVPEGWTATDDALAWTLPRETFLEEELQSQPAPYPALVTIGHDDGDRLWLLDLETLGVCGIKGERQQVADLVRFMVAELAVNTWSEGSQVLLADEFGPETVGLNPARVQSVDRRDALTRAAKLTAEMGEVEQNLGADVLKRRREALVLDTTDPVVVVVDARPTDDGFMTALEERDRSRVVIVHSADESPAIELTGDQRALLPMWGISVKAFGLSAAEAEAMAALLSSTRRADDQPVPVSRTDDGPLGNYARVNGALREEYTEPRNAEGDNPSSLLPAPDAVYMAAAATTPQDLAAAAPNVPPQVRSEIAAIDPSLDADVAAWFDDTSPRPKVRLLGPVDVLVRGGGDPGAINNLAGTISFIAYLACQERGVTGERAAEACGWKTQKTVQNRASNARFLLGTRPDGSDWLPDASASDGARRGTPTYELVRGEDGVLVDIDLFVRLRFRAQKRGEDGQQDLVTALSLVEGAPFEAVTDRRFPWLFTGQRHDDIMVAAIHDVAHLLATRALADGRTDMARLACEVARKASPHSDVAWLDLAAVEEAELGRGAADEMLREQIVDRFDEDLPPRTETILDQRDWLAG